MKPRAKRRRRLPPWVGVVTAAAVALAISLFFAGTRSHFVPSDSMVPTLLRGDQFRTDTSFAPRAGPKRGEIWVLQNPEPEDGNGPELVKRVVGLPGEKIGVANGKLTVDGKPLSEPYCPEQIGYRQAAVTLKEDEYWVLGDNRNNSQDSHSWGPVPRGLLIGRVFLRYFPPSRVSWF